MGTRFHPNGNSLHLIWELNLIVGARTRDKDSIKEIKLLPQPAEASKAGQIAAAHSGGFR